MLLKKILCIPLINFNSITLIIIKSSYCLLISDNTSVSTKTSVFKANCPQIEKNLASISLLPSLTLYEISVSKFQLKLKAKIDTMSISKKNIKVYGLKIEVEYTE